MKFTQALALVFSRRKRIEHGSWDSWARDEVKRLNEVIAQGRQHHSLFSLEGGTNGKTRAKANDIAVGPRGKAAVSKNTSIAEVEHSDQHESSPWDLNADWQAFKDAQGGDKA